MSSPPRSRASQGLGHHALQTALVTDPWNLQDLLANLSRPLQQLLNDVIGHCRASCSESIEAANAITRALHHFLQQFSAAIDAELQSNASSGLRNYIEFCGRRLLGRLITDINHHFEIRPRIMFNSADAETQSAAAAARGIAESFTRLIELLSLEEERAGNVAEFSIVLMDSEDDAEISMRLAILESISRHIVASYEQTHKHWKVAVDGESQDLRNVSGSNTPEVLKFAPAVVVAADCNGLEDFVDVRCAICMGSLFESRGDGSIKIDAREMSCPGKHTFHSQCARTCFVDGPNYVHKNTCPLCKCDFSQFFSVEIEACLDHCEPNDTGTALQWANPPNMRLAALNVLAKIPQETPLGRSTASALLWSCLDSAARVVDAALRSERLSAAFEVVPQALGVKYCCTVLESLKNAGTDGTRENLACAVAQLAELAAASVYNSAGI